jgi:tyrosyl-tRNA synthetase
MKISTDPKKIDDILSRGIEEIIDKKSLEKKLKSGKKLRIKFGIDPTGSKIHIGRAFQFWKLKAFQDLGHQIILIIGDFTGQIGDASDKNAMRKALSEKEVKENMKDYEAQIGKILNLKKTEIRHNGEWMNKLSAGDLIKLEMNFTAQQMIQRRNFEERWNSGKPIGIHELNYPIFQGYDSVMIKADVEIGGSDQLFNLKTGRKMQEIFKQSPQDIITSKMLNGTDGQKMSTSVGNIIAITDEAENMYGKIMSMRDELIPEYFELCTEVPVDKIKKISAGLKSGKLNPRDIKAELAKEIVSIYHGKKSAEEAEKEFDKIFKNKQTPSEVKKIAIKEKTIGILDLLVKMKLAPSKSEAKRLVEQNAIKINGKIHNNWKETIAVEKGALIQAGKRKFAQIS